MIRFEIDLVNFKGWNIAMEVEYFAQVVRELLLSQACVYLLQSIEEVFAFKFSI